MIDLIDKLMFCNKCKYLILLANLLIAYPLLSQKPILLNNNKQVYGQFENFNVYVDKESKLSISTIKDPEFKGFVQAGKRDFNRGLTSATVWYKFKLINQTGDRWIIKIGKPTLEEATLFVPRIDGSVDSSTSSYIQNISSREFKVNNFLMTLNFPDNKEQEFFLKVRSNHSMQVPIEIATLDSLFVSGHYKDIWAGIYLGFIFVMVLFNFFIFLSLKDISYLYYVLYTLFIGLLISMHETYPFDLFWPNMGYLNAYQDILTSLAGVFGILFTMKFLNTKVITPKIHKTLYFIMALYIIALILVFFKFTLTAAIFEEIAGLSSSLFVLFAVIYIYRLGYKEARYYLIAWSAFIVGIILFVLSDARILILLTDSVDTLQIGSAFEALFMSFALADRFNMYKKEKEELVLQQNVILETKVNERTSELSTALLELKETQDQLILHEKLASLGKMTSGIAHEIQNPLNFVNNFSDLSRELIKEAKDAPSEEERNEILTDLDKNLEKIHHHGKRADSIVKNMLMHSRSSPMTKEATDINGLVNEAINFSYNAIKSKNIGFTCEVIKDLDPHMPEVHVIAQDMSRVLLNLFNNAFYAVKEKVNAKVEVSTKLKGKLCEIRIRDNGSGMPEHVKQKIFEPFFTTKPSGEGTGLGLSICYDIIKTHNGELKVDTKENEYTEFNITFAI